jgi:hypothetical protein
VGPAGAGWEGTIVPRAAIGILACCLGLGFAACPPNEPERAEDGDLEDDEEKEDWPEPTHRAQCRDKAHCRKASTWASSKPRWVSVRTSRVGS